MEKSKKSLILDYIGDDTFSMPVYQDQFGNLWKDVDLGEQKQPCLHSVGGNAFDGDPNTPINQEFTIRTKKEYVNKEKRFQYQMLDRLRSDCEYYLGYGRRNPNCLWAGSEEAQVEKIKKIWNSFSDDEKPEWLTWKQIEKYERDMVIQNKLRPGARLLGNVGKNEMEIVTMKAAEPGTADENATPTMVLRDIATGTECRRSLESLKHCDVTITEAPALSEEYTAIGNFLIRAILGHWAVTLRLSDQSFIRGTVKSIDAESATIKENEGLERTVTISFGQVCSMFTA